jgi:hypothetical protein
LFQLLEQQIEAVAVVVVAQTMVLPMKMALLVVQVLL